MPEPSRELFPKWVSRVRFQRIDSRGWLEGKMVSKVEPQASGALKEARPCLTVCADCARQACCSASYDPI